MYLHIGQKMFGKCDVVPELFYVGTLFFHVNFVPLIPLGTHLVLGEDGKKYRTVRIPFSLKSFLYAWLRTATFIGGVVAWIVAIMAMTDGPRNDRSYGTPLVAALGCTLFYAILMLYPRRIKPTYERACKLAVLANFNERAWAALNVMYDRHPYDRPETQP